MNSRAVDKTVTRFVCSEQKSLGLGAQLTSVSTGEEFEVQSRVVTLPGYPPPTPGRKGQERIFLLSVCGAQGQCELMKMLIQNTTAVTDDNRSRLPVFAHLHL